MSLNVTYTHLKQQRRLKMKHKHHAMIVAKAENMELVVFANSGDGEWFEMKNEESPIIDFFEYFLCLPQHKEACLHWLNGGEVEFEYDSKWNSCSYWSREWHEASGFTCEDNKLRIKPKKEKRWIIWDLDNDAYNCVFKENPEGRYLANFNFQILEVELEV